MRGRCLDRGAYGVSTIELRLIPDKRNNRRPIVTVRSLRRSARRPDPATLRSANTIMSATLSNGDVNISINMPADGLQCVRYTYPYTLAHKSMVNLPLFFFFLILTPTDAMMQATSGGRRIDLGDREKWTDKDEMMTGGIPNEQQATEERT
ncbi:hypothetical protein Trydic_g19752 [Trypoxylus dichotomus]